MLLGIGFLFIGAALVLNGLWLLNRVQDREIWVINFFAGGLALIIALSLAFAPGADRVAIFGAAQVLLFAFTYLWVGINTFIKADGRGLGWFCLFVAVTAVPIAITTWASRAPLWLSLNWTAWAVLWFVFFLLLALSMERLTRPTGWATILAGIFTAWLPGYLILSGIMPPF